MRRALAAMAVAALACAAAAHAHIVYGTKTLSGLVAQSDLVLEARILESGERVGLSVEGGSASRPTVLAEVLAVWKGSFAAPRVRFAQHGHGVATFEPGDEALLFLVDIRRSRELEALGRAGALEWVSLQEHDDAYALREDTREALIGAVRGYVAAADATPPVREATLRRATVALLTSGDADLAASALRDLVLAPEAPLVEVEDLPALLPVLGDAGTSMGLRVALLAELERRGMVEGAPYWLGLLSDATPPRDRITAIRAAGLSGGLPVRARLVVLLKDADPDVAAAAASALGGPGRSDAVTPLAQALARGPEKVRNAAIRGLGRIATPDAERVLAAAAADHPDAGTRRRARAELDKRAH
jgi:HEAT repeats